MSSTEQYEKLVKFFGTQDKTAEALGCKQPSVFKWLKGKSKMSAETAIKAEKATNGQFKASELCPALAELESLN